jgi:hypothetical protein
LQLVLRDTINNRTPFTKGVQDDGNHWGEPTWGFSPFF